MRWCFGRIVDYPYVVPLSAGKRSHPLPLALRSARRGRAAVGGRLRRRGLGGAVGLHLGLDGVAALLHLQLHVEALGADVEDVLVPALGAPLEATMVLERAP